MCTFEALRSLRARLRLGRAEWSRAPFVTGQKAYQSVAIAGDRALHDKTLLQSAIHECKEALASGVDGQDWHSDKVQEQVVEANEGLQRLEHLFSSASHKNSLDIQSLTEEMRNQAKHVYEISQKTDGQTDISDKLGELDGGLDFVLHAIGSGFDKTSLTVSQRMVNLENDMQAVRGLEQQVKQQVAKVNETHLQLVTDETFKGQMLQKIQLLEMQLLSRSAGSETMQQPQFASQHQPQVAQRSTNLLPDGNFRVGVDDYRLGADTRLAPAEDRYRKTSSVPNKRIADRIDPVTGQRKLRDTVEVPAVVASVLRPLQSAFRSMDR